MALIREHTADDQWADHGVLVIRDRDGDPGDEDEYEDLGLFGENAIDTLPGGTIAHAGAGWLWASSSDGEHEVRLEAHDSPPPYNRADLDDWDDVLETPYRSLSGTVGLALLTGGDWDEHSLVAGRPGRYRVRVCCRRGAADSGAEEGAYGETWRMQFWPAPGDAEPPRWLARGRPPIGDGSAVWSLVLDSVVNDVLMAAQIATDGHPEGVPLARITAAWTEYRGPDASPRSPLWPPPPRPPLPTGHRDTDDFEARNHAELLADRAASERAVAEMAAAFGLPAPVTVGDVLPLLAALGLLTVREEGGEPMYATPAEPPRVRDVLNLPAGKQAEVDRQEAFYRYCAPATDLVSVALWTPAGRVGAVPDLARRMLMSADEVRAVLRYAEDEHALRVDDGDPGDDASPLTLTVLPRRDEEPPDPPSWEELPHVVESYGPASIVAYSRGTAEGPADVEAPAQLNSDLLAALQAFADDDPPTASGLFIVSQPQRRARPPLPAGAPPRAGIVTDGGKLVVWRNDRAEVLARLSADAFGAVETPYGIAVLDLTTSVLVRPDGQTEVLATGAGYRWAVSADGRRLALSQARWGRQPAFALHVIDLADGSRQILRWPENLTVSGMYDGGVYFSSEQEGGQRWTPGSDPESLPFSPARVDRITGAMLVDGQAEGADGWLVIAQDGTRRNVPVTASADLAPGGTHLVDFRYAPPAVTLFDIAAGGADPRVWWLPEGCDTSSPHWPVWEDTGHLLFQRPYQQGPAAVRLDIRTGVVETVPLPGLDDGAADDGAADNSPADNSPADDSAPDDTSGDGIATFVESLH